MVEGSCFCPPLKLLRKAFTFLKKTFAFSLHFLVFSQGQMARYIFLKQLKLFHRHRWIIRIKLWAWILCFPLLCKLNKMRKHFKKYAIFFLDIKFPCIYVWPSPRLIMLSLAGRWRHRPRFPATATDLFLALPPRLECVRMRGLETGGVSVSASRVCVHHTCSSAFRAAGGDVQQRPHWSWPGISQHTEH